LLQRSVNSQASDDVRFAVDTGGTFTDLVIEDEDGSLSLYKSATVPGDPVQGILDVFDVAGGVRQSSGRELLARGTVLIHGTTRGLNAVLTGTTARTAFLTTQGHPDVLVLREGGRTDVFDLRHPYPDPYVPRSLTFEVPERVTASGEVIRPLDEAAVTAIASELRLERVEAVAVCLLWSIANPAHELRVRELLEQHLPAVPVTLSHELNPCLREYRRASATAIDASLKPIMTAYIAGLRSRLEEAGFRGRLLIVTSAGAALDADDVAAAPIHSLNSGPAMAPVAGRHYAETDAASDVAIVADTGGTSYDVSLVRRGRIPWSRETWLGRPYFGHMTGFPSVDVRSVGAGGGSIASVDSGGLLRVGPESAGADPGPACYGLGGNRPTLTDACLLTGLLDPDYFLGGRTPLDVERARVAIGDHVARGLGLTEIEAAAAILRVATERMVSAIEEITIHQGIDPRQAVLVGGGGAAGLNSVAIARLLGCREVIIPSVGPALSAAGALISDLSRNFEIPFRVVDTSFDFDGVNGVLAELERRAQTFIAGPGTEAIRSTIELSVEVRYPQQVWELEVPLRTGRLRTQADLDQLCRDFHAVHRDVFAVADESSAIEFESWHARARCQLVERVQEQASVSGDAAATTREVYLPELGSTEMSVWRLASLPIGEPRDGPAVIESATTTVLVDPGATFCRRPSGTLHITPNATARHAGVASARSDVDR
jgi:N-methylhydantoinase A